jgi:FixJ family two-component response regulator
MANPPLISIVDDDDSVRESLRGLIRSVGFAAKAFATAEEFLSWQDSRNTDCLILDMRMPGMNGLELQQRLAAKHSAIPVIFITAHEDEEVRTRALGAGAVDFLCKPFSEEALLKAINLALASK